MAVANRQYIENLIYDVFDAMDPSGSNTNKYKLMFQDMNDKEFEKFMKSFLSNDNEHFSLDIVEFEHGLDMNYCEKAAKILGIPLMEYVYMPHLTMDKKNVIVSKEKCLVGYFNVKRTQQLLHKKNGISLANEKVSGMTGQVVDKDKNARDSDIEASLLVSLGAENILKELHGPRSDDMVMKRQMNQDIANKGYTMLEDLDSSPINKTTLNTVDTFLLGMMLKSDLISDTYILPKISHELFDQ